MNNFRHDKKEIDALIHERIYSNHLHAVTDLDIARAISSALTNNEPAFKEGKPSKQFYIWNNNKHKVEYEGSKYNYGGKTGNDGYGLWFWHNRFHTSYQNDIEAHVKDWKVPVPFYSSDIALAMTVAEKVALFDTIMLEKTKGEKVWHAVRKPTPNNMRLEHVSMGYTASEAIARACLVISANSDQEPKKLQYSYSGI